MTSDFNVGGTPVTMSTLPVTKKDIRSDILPSLAHYRTIKGIFFKAKPFDICKIFEFSNITYIIFPELKTEMAL